MHTELFDLTGSLALVTGSTRGLGLHMARGLARYGARVVVHGRDPKDAERVADTLRGEGCEACHTAFNVSDEAQVNRALDEIEQNVGRVDILVNNAGINLRSPLEAFDLETWRTVLDTNLTGLYVVTRRVVQGMIEHNAGKIINVCSLMSEVGRPTTGAYAASKGAVKMLTRSMATEWARRNIQVNGIGPGYFDTDMTRGLVQDPEFNAWICRRTPAGRWGKPDELVGAVVFLASRASSFVNGQVLYVDGGLLACV